MHQLLSQILVENVRRIQQSILRKMWAEAGSCMECTPQELIAAYTPQLASMPSNLVLGYGSVLKHPLEFLSPNV